MFRRKANTRAGAGLWEGGIPGGDIWIFLPSLHTPHYTECQLEMCIQLQNTNTSIVIVGSTVEISKLVIIDTR